MKKYANLLKVLLTTLIIGLVIFAILQNGAYGSDVSINNAIILLSVFFAMMILAISLWERSLINFKFKSMVNHFKKMGKKDKKIKLNTLLV